MLSNKLFPPWTADGGKQGRERLASGSPRAQASVRGSPCACRARSWRQGWRKMQVNFTAHDPTADHWRFGVLLGGISRPLYAGWLALWTCLLKRIPSFFQKDSSGNASRVASSQPQKSRSASSETVALVVMEAPSAVRSLMSPWRLTRVFLRGASAPSLLRPSSSFRLAFSQLHWRSPCPAQSCRGSSQIPEEGLRNFPIDEPHSSACGRLIRLTQLTEYCSPLLGKDALGRTLSS